LVAYEAQMSSPSAVLAVLQAAADAAAATSQVGGAVVSVRAALDSPLQSIAGREISAAAGWADTHREAMTTSSRLCWGSCTKTVTAAAVMRAVEAGLLALDDPVAPLIDPLIAASRPMAAGGSLAELFGEGHAGITTRQLLQMRTGIADFEHEGLAADGRTSYEVWWAGDQHGVWSPIEQLAWASVKHRRPPHFLPDEGGAYTSTNYTLLGLVLQGVHNLPRWEDVEALLLETLPEESRATTNFPSVGTCESWRPVCAGSFLPS
jgi:CubicO group peptidase (beta-lactamase class C family)